VGTYDVCLDLLLEERITRCACKNNIPCFEDLFEEYYFSVERLKRIHSVVCLSLEKGRVGSLQEYEAKFMKVTAVVYMICIIIKCMKDRYSALF